MTKKTTTLREKYVEALRSRGEVVVETTFNRRFVKLTRKSGGFYFVGKSGSIRVGHTARGSLPATDKFKASLLVSPVT